jgi:hypothetical protein
VIHTNTASFVLRSFDQSIIRSNPASQTWCLQSWDVFIRLYHFINSYSSGWLSSTTTDVSMGGNASIETQDNTVMAYTLYGFGCCNVGRCCHNSEFFAGAPRELCCGVSGQQEFTPPLAIQPILEELETGLEEAANISMNHVTWCSHICCSGFDSTGSAAARALNADWCRRWNIRLNKHGLQIHASSEVFGFGRSRATFLVLRVHGVADRT